MDAIDGMDKIDIAAINWLKEKTLGILEIKKSDPNSDTLSIEAEIDKMVCQLYGLTEEEIKIVEGETV